MPEMKNNSLNSKTEKTAACLSWLRSSLLVPKPRNLIGFASCYYFRTASSARSFRNTW